MCFGLSHSASHVNGVVADLELYWDTDESVAVDSSILRPNRGESRR